LKNFEKKTKHILCVDIRELIEIDDAMDDQALRFGPNGGLIFCMEYVIN
jgi:hypothetical protein